MRYSQLIEYTKQDNLLNDIEEYIVRSKARGFSKINTQSLLRKMQMSGYSIDEESLLDLLNRIETVGSADSQEITLASALPDSPDQEPGEEDDTVRKLADKQLKRQKNK